MGAQLAQQQTAGRIEDFSRPAGVALLRRPLPSTFWWSSFVSRAAAELPRAWLGWRAGFYVCAPLGPQLGLRRSWTALLES